MHAMIMVDQEWLADRRQRGIDRWDEVWDGVLHVPPEPTSDHQRIEERLGRGLAPLAERRAGFELLRQLSILDPRDHNKNYRTPDILVVESRHVIRRGTEGPVELAIEILSPEDKSRDKLPFYAARGVKELWLVEPETREVEVYLLRGTSYYIAVADRAGVTHAPALDLELSIVAGPKLRVAWPGGAAEV
ncbi:MAG TPA: Uma2 family endonuclease [Kofleriaceae bacterium]|jgi:Uma2 family endonuclease